MYILPGYVSSCMEGTDLLITSQLLQNTVKISEPALQQEFHDIVNQGGCAELDTPLTRFLYEQEMLAEAEKIKSSLTQAKDLLKEDLLVTIMPTDACNFRCPYCYEDHAAASMSWEMLAQIKEYLAAQAPHFKAVNIGWFGGEPTLCKDMVLDVATFMKEIQKKHSFRYTSHMTTNGYLLTDDLLKNFFLAGVTSYQITLDGWNHDKTRPHVSGEGTLRQILDNLTAISALPKETYPFHITLRHNILAGDRDFSWYDHLYQLFGTDERFAVSVQPVSNWGGESVQSLNLLGSFQKELLAEHTSYLEKIGMKYIPNLNGPFSKVCCASYPNSMIFRASGKIEKCTICLEHPKNLVGHVDCEKGVILDPAANALWTENDLKPECYTCPDVLSCLNLRCGRLTIVEGRTNARCPRASASA